jgi:energy-coupling factor transporter transmembrane protein EcfT
VRFKLVLMAAASLACLMAGVAGLTLLALACVALFLLAGREAIPPARALKGVGLLLAFVAAARALSTAGAALVSLGPLSVTREGLTDGALISLRLALIFALGTVFAVTSRALEIKAGVQWFLKPLPFVPAARVGTMLGLLVRFLPLIFEQAAATADAQRARAVENRRNPLRRLALFGLPFMRRVFETADRLALAMEARGYSEMRTDPELCARSGDWLGFGAAAGLVVLSAIL